MAWISLDLNGGDVIWLNSDQMISMRRYDRHTNVVMLGGKENSIYQVEQYPEAIAGRIAAAKRSEADPKFFNDGYED